MAASMATAKGLNGIEAGVKKLAKPKLGDVQVYFVFQVFL